MATIRNLLATTRVDLHGECFAREALENAAKDFSAQCVPVLWNHDLRYPPIGRSLSAEVQLLDDGEWGLYVESEIFEPGVEPPSSERKLPFHAFKSDRLTVVLDRSDRHAEDQQIARELEHAGVHIETQAKKAVEPLSALIIGIVAAASAGFFGKMGSDAWDALKPKIAALLARRRTEQREYLLVVEVQITRAEGPLIVRAILDSPDQKALEAFWSTGIRDLEAGLLRHLASVPPDVRMLVYMYSDGQLKPAYAVRKDCVPLMFSTGRDMAANLGPAPDRKRRGR